MLVSYRARAAPAGRKASSLSSAQAEELGFSSLWVNDFLLTPRIEALTMLVLTAGAALPGRSGPA